METGKNLNILLEKHDLLAIVRDVAEDFKVIGKARNVGVHIEAVGLDKLVINLDRDKIREVIANLISNAVKYSNPNSTVEVKLNVFDGFCYLDVTDHGIGIPKEDQGRIFQKFFRADNAIHLQTEGSGLGTYISRMIARFHGGDVTFYSQSGSHTTFTLKLPINLTEVQLAQVQQ